MNYQQLSKKQLIQALQEIEKLVDKEETEKKRWENIAKKMKADFENYKKRETKRKKRWKEETEKNLARELISVMDNLERAIMSANQDSTILQGVKMVADQLYETLEKKGLQRIDAEGEEFDPRIHNAVKTVENGEENKVVEEKRKGYIYKDHVLRESEVVVGKKIEE